MNEAYEGSIYNDSGNPQGSVNAMALGWSSAKLTYNGAHLLSPPALTTGAIVQHALDATTHRYWIKIDNGQWNLGAGDPALGTGGIDVSGLGTGTIYPLAYIRVGGSEILGHFIAADMAKAVPTGFAPIAG
jgi:hypothetical protein